MYLHWFWKKRRIHTARRSYSARHVSFCFPSVFVVLFRLSVLMRIRIVHHQKLRNALGALVSVPCKLAWL